MICLNHCFRLCVPFVAACLALSFPVVAQDYVNFEGAQTHPIAVSSDGTRLYVVNTPDNRLAVYSLEQPSAPILLVEIRVGLEPISVAARTTDEVWVVNHESDSISVVSVSRGIVIDTIQVEDEPGDVVFAGGKAFVSVATGRKILVFDARSRKPAGTVAIFGDDPKALAVSADGRTVWVAVKRSGNRTTTVPLKIAPPPSKPTNPNLPKPPQTGLIVSIEDAAWKAKLKMKLPDHDVVEIDVNTLQIRRNYSGVGTILYNLRARPGSNELWVVNTEARNKVRFEPAIRGHVIDNRVTIIKTGSTPSVVPVDLNPGIDYKKLPNDAALSTALALPTDIVFAPDGRQAFVAAFGTDRIGVLDTTGKVLRLIEVGDTPRTKTSPRTKRGPRGLAHHPQSALLYVSNRIANSIAVIDTAAGRVIGEISMSDPTPRIVKEGRGFLYDAKLSGNGTMACAACHVDGRVDNLAWDLGDPGGQMLPARGADRNNRLVHPMKGPMMTQTLQGLKGLEPYHWRGDRPDLQSFNPAFESLLGKQKLASSDMNDFAHFLDSITYGSNPNRNLDDSLPDKPTGMSAADGFKIFMNTRFQRRDFGGNRCVQCHTLDKGSRRFLNTSSVSGQFIKDAQLRNIYKKTGRKVRPLGRTSGFGLFNDGTKDDTFDLLSETNFPSLRNQPADKTRLMRFVEAFPTGTPPIVGYSRTVSAQNVGNAAVVADLNLLVSQANSRKCDLVAHGSFDGRRAGFVYDRVNKSFQTDRASAPPLTLAGLTDAIKNKRARLTFFGVPLGSGTRIGVDRDADGRRDGDEGLSSYGTSTPACATLRLSGNSSPELGNRAFAFVVEGAAKRSAGLLLIGSRAASLRVLDLTLLVELSGALVTNVVADIHGVVAVPAPIPDLIALKGRSIYCQAAMLGGCGASGLEASAGLKLTFVQ